MLKASPLTVFAVTLALGACALAPTSPSVLALPAPGKPYAEFQVEDMNCRATAQQATAGQAEAANNRAIGGAVLGTALGAAGGALIGSAFRNPGAGAAIGATAGLGVGSSYGSGANAYANYTIQQRFDLAYTQCMYAKGHRVPVSGQMTARPGAQDSYAPPPAGSLPPPPPRF